MDLRKLYEDLRQAVANRDYGKFYCVLVDIQVAIRDAFCPHDHPGPVVFATEMPTALPAFNVKEATLEMLFATGEQCVEECTRVAGPQNVNSPWVALLVEILLEIGQRFIRNR